MGVRIPLRRGVLDITLCDKICQGLASGRWFSPDTPVSSTNKTDRHGIAEILLKVALSTINQTKPFMNTITKYPLIYLLPNMLMRHTMRILELEN
jgi:hypothetical protein